ncbi:unnamed protein product [Linum tenue]|uniref:Uncharacterized protein n=1 Tax=Linum tenue TaxID=586396 RepID=A0AAV0JFG4_9ROSI|nr:unnamed protein product [Linum tenue]
MEESPPWEERLHHTITHILTSPTTSPPLHSQFLVARQFPCYLNWDYPPILCRRHDGDTAGRRFPSLLQRWGFSQFVKRASRFGLPETSWRSKCPYQQPPPLVLARGLEEARWGDEEKREYFRKRLRRKKIFNNIHPLIPAVVPNLCLLSFLLWNPFPDEEW